MLFILKASNCRYKKAIDKRIINCQTQYYRLGNKHLHRRGQVFSTVDFESRACSSDLACRTQLPVYRRRERALGSSKTGAYVSGWKNMSSTSMKNMKIAVMYSVYLHCIISGNLPRECEVGTIYTKI